MLVLINFCLGMAVGKMRRLMKRVAGNLERRGRPIEPITLQTIDVGDRLLAHDARTGTVHLLDVTAARVLTAVRGEGSLSALEALLEEKGIEKSEARSAIARLQEKGLVRSTPPHAA